MYTQSSLNRISVLIINYNNKCAYKTSNKLNKKNTQIILYNLNCVEENKNNGIE